jgi:hypothetical protein
VSYSPAIAHLPIAGVIEGFYGRPWSTDERLSVMATCAGWGMTDYVYAPKDDPKHRHDWRVPYDDAELDEFAVLAKAGTLRLGFGISPGLSINPDDPDDCAHLADKVDAVVDRGAGLVVLCLDDIPFGGAEQGAAHARLGAWLADHVADRAALALVPTEYVGIRRTPYLSALGAGLPGDVPIGWTGDAVVNDQITATQAQRRGEALGGRPPLVWDNVPVNDGLMGDRLHLGPLWGRDPHLVDDDVVIGWLSNPMVQPTASLLPLASIAAWLRREDPLDAWAAEADQRGWRVFAEACDGAVPKAIVALVVDAFAAGRLEPAGLEALRSWFGDAAAAEAPGLEDECRAWIDQTRAEAGVALAAVDLVERALGDEPPGDLAEPLFVLGFRWKALLRSEVSVMGPRLGFSPALGQAGDGTWAVRRSALVEGASAVDALCRLAFDAVAWAGERA